MTGAAETVTFAFSKLVVHDLTKEAAFYRDVCGYRVDEPLTAEVAARRIEEIVLRTPAGALDLVLLRYLDEAAPANGAVITAFDTGDLDAFQARVLTAGGSVQDPIKWVEFGTKRMRIAFFADPEGHLFEVMER